MKIKIKDIFVTREDIDENQLNDRSRKGKNTYITKIRNP